MEVSRKVNSYKKGYAIEFLKKKEKRYCLSLF
jgi:hypothetical protein